MFGSGVVAGDWPAGPALFGLIVAREVAAKRGPCLSAVERTEEHIATVVESLGIVRRDHRGRRPAEAVLLVFRPVAGRIEWIDADVPGLPSSAIVSRENAVVLAGEHDVGIRGVGGDIAGFAAADVEPVVRADAARRQTVAWSGGGAKVLHCSV